MQTRKFNLRGRIVCTQTIEAYVVVVCTYGPLITKTVHTHAYASRRPSRPARTVPCLPQKGLLY